MWDGPDGEPIITHGQTLTGTLYVRDVLADAIKPYAFKSSPYPLILSIENHLSPEQQDVLAIRFKDILAGRFFTSVVLNWWLDGSIPCFQTCYAGWMCRIWQCCHHRISSRTKLSSKPKKVADTLLVHRHLTPLNSQTTMRSRKKLNNRLLMLLLLSICNLRFNNKCHSFLIGWSLKVWLTESIFRTFGQLGKRLWSSQIH